MTLTALVPPPLIDDDGIAFADLPCMRDPAMWDSDGTPAQHRIAQTICKTMCPALVACKERTRAIGRDKIDGVVAGSRPSKRYRTEVPAVEDHAVLAWARQAGVNIP